MISKSRIKTALPWLFTISAFLVFTLQWANPNGHNTITPVKVKKITLGNGIRVILAENHLTPTFSVSLKIAAGSSNESFDDAGAAHFLEHLLFKGNTVIGTKNYSREKIYLEQIHKDGEKMDLLRRKIQNPTMTPEDKKATQDEILRLEKRKEYFERFASRFVIPEEDSYIYSLAGESGYNAYTSADLTSYEITLPANQMELWAMVESERFLHPVFREFYTERKVIEEERKMRYDSHPQNLLYEYYIMTAYGFSPYGKPVIGFSSGISHLSYGGVKKFYDENYISSRMVIVASGNLNFEESEKIIRKYFSRLPASPTPPFPVVKQNPGSGKIIKYLHVKANPYMIMGWHKPSLLHPDDTYLDFLQIILAGSPHSRLEKKLVQELNLASSVDAVNGIPGKKLDNQFTLFISPYKESDYQKIESVIDAELQDIALHGITPTEKSMVKNTISMEYAEIMEKNEHISEVLSHYEVLANDYQYFFRRVKKSEEIDNEIMKKVAGTYFKDERKTMVMIQGK